jgi:PPK2 family polyphosphate:nucleotide phosphotransferase
MAALEEGENMLDSHYRVEPGKKLHLGKIPTDTTGHFKDKDDARDATRKEDKKLIKLQDLLYASANHSLLVVLQAMDAGGKDGSIEHVFSGVNPQGCSVTSFKVPSHEELSHDYLWRYHKAAPSRGMIGIFNRSHYESVLVERVKKIVPQKVWSKRYDQINQFEKMLSDEGTVILKFYLHISKEEQRRRLQARLEDPSKNWKFSHADVAERRYWDDYFEAYQDAVQNCSTNYAPWYVVPADHKWFRNWVLSSTIVRTLQKLDLKYPEPEEGIDKIKVE